MRHKFKLSFSVLMISSCLVQIANAAGSKNEPLGKLTSIENKGEVPKGSALVTILLPSNNITIEDGSVEIVDNGGMSIGATVKKGGKQIVTRGATAANTKISGGKQFVYGESFINHNSSKKPSSAYNATVSGGDGGTVGQQNVYDGGTAWNAKVMNGGEQNLYMGQREEGGIAQGTIVSGNGRQHVLAGGIASNTTLSGSALQVAYPDGIVDGLMIKDNASSWIHVGAEVSGNIEVNGRGHLYLYAGDRTNHMTKERVSIEGRSAEVLSSVGMRHNNDRPQIDMEELSGDGGIVIFTSVPYDQRHISLHVEKLSGNLNFHFNISSTGNQTDYLWIDSGAGNHKISVTDSGAEITGLFSQKNGLLTQINLVTDRSNNGGANFTLADLSGKNIKTVDGGVYQYQLWKRDRCADSSGSATIWYLGRSTGSAGRSNTSSHCVNQKSKISVVAFTNTDTRTQSHQKLPASQNTNGKGKRKQTIVSRPPRHLREAQQDLASSTVSSPEDQFFELSRSAGRHHPSDEQQQPIVAADAQTLADQMTVRPSDQDQPFAQLRQELPVSDFLTTPSTDAVLSMSVTPGLIFHNELQTVRAGRGTLDRNKKNTALWTYAIKSKENVATEHIDFKLEQTGIVLGISGFSELADGEFYIGGFGSYDQARVAHARGGISSINTYGIGAYATYFDHSGLYLDGVLKYNHYQNDLKAVSTNGLAIEGSYKQWVVGTSFEAGYRFEVTQSGWMQPYAQFTWLQAEGKEIKLSNEMTGNISPFTSLRSEVGLSLGYEFGLGMDASSLAYITAAWLRENKDNNHTTINQQHKFTTDLSGNAGKLGVGLSSLVSDRLKLYAEAHYVKGRKTKQSLQGIFGVRYSF